MKKKFSVPTDAVTIAYVHENDVTASFQESFQHLMLYDQTQHARIMRGGYVKIRCATNGLVEARNRAVISFLEKDSDWLLWIDTDMGFAPDSLERLMKVADPVERPIIGGLCFANKETDMDGMGGYHTAARVTIFDWATLPGDDIPTFTGKSWYPPNTVLECAGTGSAFILIHRSVFEKLGAEHGPTWYDRIQGDDGKLIGEDISFCVRANALGMKVYVHTGVRTTHMKTIWLGEHDWWRQAEAPPANELIDVIVPVMKRPENAERFMRSLRASTGLAEAWAVCDPDDAETREAWERAGANVVDSFDGSSFATKMNCGYQVTGAFSRPWLFMAGDDVVFQPGWLDHAQYAAQIMGAHVVGTNDLVNPRVMRGEHGTHLLVRRSYVDEVGASWDGPGIVAHEGYGHWFVDDEIVTAAKQRDVWTSALASRVEHLHPLYGKAPVDEVYELGLTHQERDQRTYNKRLMNNQLPMAGVR